MIRAIVHLHSHHSYDSYSKVKDLMRKAVENKIDVLAITDHDTLKGSLEASGLADDFGLNCIVGAEYLTDCGDIIGLFLKEEIKTKNAFEVIDEIKRQGGLSILPHPFYHHTQIEALAERVDCVEIFNARCSEKENVMAVQLAAKLKKPCTAGPDAHFVSELMNAYMEYEYSGVINAAMFLNIQPKIVSEYSRREDLYYSQMVKGFKSIDPLLIARQIYNLAK